MYRTNKDLEITAFECQAPAMRSKFILPAGSKAIFVRALDGVKGDGFAAGDPSQIVALTGNSHDPHYRYIPLAADDIEGETEDEQREVMRVREKDARITG